MKIEDIKVITKDVSYNTIINIVNYIIANSFDKNHVYHDYLYENAETASVLVSFTDYKPDNDNGNMTIDEVMKIRRSKKWDEITLELGWIYDDIERYAYNEIQALKQPFAEYKTIIITINELLENINGIINAVDTEKLAQMDFSNLAEALDKLGEVAKAEKTEKTE